MKPERNADFIGSIFLDIYLHRVYNTHMGYIM